MLKSRRAASLQCEGPRCGPCHHPAVAETWPFPCHFAFLSNTFQHTGTPGCCSVYVVSGGRFLSVVLRLEAAWGCSGTFGHRQLQLTLLHRQDRNERSQKSLSYPCSCAEIGLKILLWEQDLCCKSLFFGSLQPVLVPSPGGNLACPPAGDRPPVLLSPALLSPLGSRQRGSGTLSPGAGGGLDLCTAAGRAQLDQHAHF